MTFKEIREFDWEDLKDKVVKIAVVELSVDHLGRVYAVDIDLNAYLLDEWYTEEKNRA